MATQKNIQRIKQSISLLHYAANQGTRFERRGEEYWACCPLPGHDEKTPSFAIKLKNGEEVFFCQGCSKGGDLIRFVELTEGLATKDAISKLDGLSYAPDAKATFAENSAWAADAAKVASSFVNIADSKPKETLPLEKWETFVKALADNTHALAWLKEKRGIDSETALRLKFGFQQSNKGKLPPEFETARDGGWILLPRINGDKVVAIKKRGMAAKAFTQVPNMDAKALFNMDAANALEDLFVTEGEFDSAIFEMCGFRAVSIPNASSKLTPENKIILKRAARVFLAGDNDGGVGNAAMRNLQRELCENTYLFEWPGAKDANEFFLKVCGGDIAEFQKRVAQLVTQALSTPAEGFMALTERVRLAATIGGGTDLSGDPRRLHFPYTRLDNMSYSVPGSVVTFYSTYSGTGKTVFITQLMLKEAERGETVVVYSPEVRDSQYLALVAAQKLGPLRLPVGLNRAGTITPQDYAELYDILSTPLESGAQMQYYVGHGLPVSDGKEILDFIEKVIVATGATRFVIDTFHRIVTPVGRESVVDAEGRTMRELEALAIKHKMIFVIIGQSNKEAEDLKEVRKDAQGTLRGNREITDISDAVYLIHRKRNANAQPGDVAVDLLENDTTVVLVKGRVQGMTGKFCRLLYKKECSKFYEVDANRDQNAPPISNGGDMEAGFGD